MNTEKVNVLGCIFQVRFTPSGTNMKILQPHVIAIRRNYLPALKVEYSTSAHQSAFRIQVYRIQVSLKRLSNCIHKEHSNKPNVFPWSLLPSTSISVLN